MTNQKFVVFVENQTIGIMSVNMGSLLFVICVARKDTKRRIAINQLESLFNNIVKAHDVNAVKCEK